MHPAVIEVTQEDTTAIQAAAAVLTLTVPEDGNVRFSFRLKEDVLELFVRVRLLLPPPSARGEVLHPGEVHLHAQKDRSR